MSVKPGRADVNYVPKSRQTAWKFMSGYLLQCRLRWAAQGIDRLERQLAEEFATVDTLPLHAELENLRAERDRLQRALQGGI
jgi:hypothetical protein